MKKIRFFRGKKRRSFAEHGGKFDEAESTIPIDATFDSAEEDQYEDVFSSTPKPSFASRFKEFCTQHKPKFEHASHKDHYELKTFLVSVRPSEWICLAFDLLALFALSAPAFSWYLWAVVFAADCAAWISHVYWFKKHYAMTMSIPWQNPTPAAVRCMMAVIGAVYLVNTSVVAPVFANLLWSMMWYVVVVTAVYNAFNCIIKTMNRHNPDWLGKIGQSNNIGLPNKISVSRIACAMLIPHIYVTETFGSYSSAIATLLLGVAIVTDFIDGKIARQFHMVTRVGKALDPLGDKFIFYPVGVAFLLMTDFGIMAPGMSNVTSLVAAAALVIVLRDILVIAWFFIKGKDLASGIGASMVDKVRMATICGWLGGTALSVTVPQTALGNIMAWIGFICLILAAILSVLSLGVDIDRVQKLRAKLEGAAKSENNSDTSKTTGETLDTSDPVEESDQGTLDGHSIADMTPEELDEFCRQFGIPTDDTEAGKYELGEYNGPMHDSNSDK